MPPDSHPISYVTRKCTYSCKFSFLDIPQQFYLEASKCSSVRSFKIPVMSAGEEAPVKGIPAVGAGLATMIIQNCGHIALESHSLIKTVRKYIQAESPENSEV
jgi:hypothetical protein